MPHLDNLGLLIGKTHKALRKKFMAILADYDLTPPQAMMLRMLFEQDGQTARDLVEDLFSDSSTIVAIIDKLEEKNLVFRQDDPHDRRLNRIYLTDKAKQLRPQLMGRILQLHEAMMANLTEQEIVSLKVCLNKLYEFAVDGAK